MVYGVVFALVVVCCGLLSLGLFSVIRAERLARQGSIVGERELFERGFKESKDREASAQRALLSIAPNTSLVRKLKAAGIRTHPVLWLALLGLGELVVGACCFAATGTLLGCAVGVILVGLVVRMYLGYRHGKRKELFDVQLAEALPQISASVRGSLTLERALRVAVVHMQDPLREEFVRTLADAAYGMPLHEALEEMAERTQNADVKTLAAAAKLRQSRGGSISAALSMISERVNARLRAGRELKTEIASTRMAKWFVAAAMPAIFLIMYASNRDFAHFYTTETLGWTVLGVAALLEVVGLIVAHRITRLDV